MSDRTNRDIGRKRAIRAEPYDDMWRPGDHAAANRRLLMRLALANAQRDIAECSEPDDVDDFDAAIKAKNIRS